jgi:hypothetical protein
MTLAAAAQLAENSDRAIGPNDQNHGQDHHASQSPFPRSRCPESDELVYRARANEKRARDNKIPPCPSHLVSELHCYQRCQEKQGNPRPHYWTAEANQLIRAGARLRHFRFFHDFALL